jgi:hypothetical protein
MLPLQQQMEQKTQTMMQQGRRLRPQAMPGHQQQLLLELHVQAGPQARARSTRLVQTARHSLSLVQ